MKKKLRAANACHRGSGNRTRPERKSRIEMELQTKLDNNILLSTISQLLYHARNAVKDFAGVAP
jgi:hypothetical protein